MRVEVWTALVKTPDNRYTTVTVHPTEEAAADSLWEKYVGDHYEEGDESYFPKREDVDMDIEDWVRLFGNFFNFEVALDSHIVGDAGDQLIRVLRPQEQV